MQRGGDFKTYFQQSLERTKDRTHARLSTQRKILTVLWAMWKRNERYRPLGGASEAEEVAPEDDRA
jgi:hypothetical protein